MAKLISSFFIIIIFVSANIKAYAQFPGIQWDRSIGYSLSHEFSELALTLDGNYIIGGAQPSNCFISSHGHGATDFWVAKVNPAGNVIWENHFGSSNVESLESITPTSDGGYLLGGWSNSNPGGDKSGISKGMDDYWIIKIDAIGIKEWDKTFGGNNNDYLSTVIQTTDGGFLLGGLSTSLSGPDKVENSDPSGDFWIIKTDGLGNKVWEKTFQDFSINWLKSIIQTADGGYLIGGYTMSGGSRFLPAQGGRDYHIYKLNSSGIISWSRRFGGAGEDYLESLIQTNDGGYLLGGYSDSGISGNKTQISQGNSDYWILKLNSSGILQWQKTFGGNDYDQLYSIIQTTDGGFMLAGNSLSGISGNKSEVSRGVEDYWIIKTDAVGTKLWDKTIGGDDVDILTTIKEFAPDQFILGGSSRSEISGEKTQTSFGRNRKFWLVKTGKGALGEKENLNSFQIDAFPNPNNGTFTLQIGQINSTSAALIITDITGRQILQQDIPVVNNKVSQVINITATNGVYFLQLKAGNKLFTKKLICN